MGVDVNTEITNRRRRRDKKVKVKFLKFQSFEVTKFQGFEVKVEVRVSFDLLTFGPFDLQCHTRAIHNVP